MEKWEYKYEAVMPYNFIEKLNKLGEDGWELAFAEVMASEVVDNKVTHWYRCTLKRQKPPVETVFDDAYFEAMNLR